MIGVLIAAAVGVIVGYGFALQRHSDKRAMPWSTHCTHEACGFQVRGSDPGMVLRLGEVHETRFHSEDASA